MGGQERSKNINSNQRFSDTLAGKKLESIRLSMPHHDLLQKLVGDSIKLAFKNFPGERIIIAELGTGTGFTATEILNADLRIRLVSADNEPQMTAEARNSLKDFAAGGRLEIKDQDSLEFLKSFSDESLDSVVTAFTIHNFENNYRKKVLKEIFRVLKTKGIFINADKYSPSNRKEYQKEFAWQMKQFKNAPDDETKKGWLEHYEIDNRPEIIMGADEALAQMKKIGFREIKLSDRHHLEALLTAKK